MNTIKVFHDTIGLYEALADHIIMLAQQVITSNRLFTVALSGGSTPRGLYHLLTTENYSTQLDWPRIHIFFGDERYVPKDHPDSNYRMISEILINHIPIPHENIHRIRCELEPRHAAEDYEQMLLSFFTSHSISKRTSVNFDFILLGIGSDGHTASLFPERSTDREKSNLVNAYFVEKLNTWRISFTPVLINAAAQVTFLASGLNKAKIVKEVLEGPYEPDTLPSQGIHPNGSPLEWFIDRQAASQLRSMGKREE